MKDLSWPCWFTQKGDWWWLFEIASLRFESVLKMLLVLDVVLFHLWTSPKLRSFFNWVNPFRFIPNYSSIRMSYKHWGISKIIHRSSPFPPQKRYKISWHQRNLGSMILFFYVHKGSGWWTKIRLAAILTKRPILRVAKQLAIKHHSFSRTFFFWVVVPQKWVGLS